jgi:hypothetical protein
MKKIILFGLLGGALVLGIGMLTGQLYQILIPSIVTEFENQSLFRSWNDPIVSIPILVRLKSRISFSKSYI